jgi:sugar O-acyltransferase (sialic acid O-acetyltransferase NeuD family)
MNNLLFYGFGGHGQVVEIALDSSQALVGFFDASLPKDWGGKLPYLGKYDPSVLPECALIVTIGDNTTRAKVVAEIQHGFGQVISPLAFCAPQVPIGKGTVILQGAVVQARASIGAHVIVNAGAVIDHDAEVGDFVHIGPGAVVASLTKIGAGAYIGAGAVVPSRSNVPPGTVLPAGAVFQAPL